MKNIKQQLLITKNDYEIIMAYLQHGFFGRRTFSRQDAEYLKEEISKAKVVRPEELPADVVQLNSTVLIEDEDKKPMQLMLVTPDKADISQKKISVLAPIGTALIGFRKGQKVSWKVPSGKKIFTILEVANYGNNKIPKVSY